MKQIFYLPEVIQKEHKSKRMVSNPNLHLLIEDQRLVFDDLVKFFDSKEKYIRVRGKAGVGKTFVMSMFSEYLLYKFAGITICQCAPTNKAVRVMVEMAEYYDTRLEYKTVHSLLGIRLKRKDGKEVYEQEGTMKINSFDLVIVDEASMVDLELLDLIQSNSTTKVIFVGDPNQLPPVVDDDKISIYNARGFNPDISPVYQLRMNELNLSKIVRQAEGNPIIVLAGSTIEKQYIPIPKYDFAQMDESENPRGVFQFKKNDPDDFGFFSDVIIHYFTSPNYKADANFCKVLCFTNAMVEKYNELIRYYYFGEDADLPKITYGERLVVSEGIKDLSYVPERPGDERLIYNVNDELEVKSYTIETMRLLEYDIKFYEAMVVNLNDPNAGVEQINIVHEHSADTLRSILQRLYKLASSLPKGHKRSEIFKDYFQIKDFFANVIYGYAITVHKSQGSTYNYVIYDMLDLKYARTTALKQKLQYTAFTRAKDRLHIIY